jgi:hypothetical protein
MQLGQKPRRLHEKATGRLQPQSAHLARTNPCPRIRTAVDPRARVDVEAGWRSTEALDVACDALKSPARERAAAFVRRKSGGLLAEAD